VHICRKWRHIVFSSHQALQLQLFCTHRTPVLKTLECWPTLPIVVEYRGSPALDTPAPADDDDDVMAALRHCHRVTSIDLSVTSSLRDRFSAIKEQFSELEDLVLQSQDGLWMTLPSVFRWGPRLHRLHLTRIAIPELTQLLTSSRNLVDIQLHEMPAIGYSLLTPFRKALSEMTQLQSLSLQFLPNPIYPEIVLATLSLPTLTRLKYQGASEYLDNLVAGIDAPRLEVVEIKFSDEIKLHTPNIGKFINQMGKQNSQHHAEILFSKHYVSITLTQPVPSCLPLKVLCRPSSPQLLFITQICHHISTSLLNVEQLKLHISSSQPSRERCDRDREGWIALINAFRSTRRPYFAVNFSRNIVLALESSESTLPAPHKLHIRRSESRDSDAILRKVVGSFMHLRELSGHFMAVEYDRPLVSGIGTKFA
jgi:hypothetical protein